jgi:glycosyltransferase involved in cell wall biosynthesis
MKIAIIMSGQAIEPGGGVRMQGLMWRDGLKLLGHNVDLINFWEEYDWKSYDAIIVLQMVGQFGPILKLLYKNNSNILFAPILDPGPNATISRYKFLAQTLSKIKNSKIGHISHMTSDFIEFYDNRSFIKTVLVRSKQEEEYVSKCFNISLDKIKLIPLSLRFDPLEEFPAHKENFCFHVSRLASPNKNVERLVEAAKKYKFQLKLAGYLHGESEKSWMNNLIKESPNIEYVGAVSDTELKKFYMRAKVFALPSYVEGVGMVAMEAAGYGCEIVLTNMGAPKDYYNGLAELVDPFSIDDIGMAIIKCLEKGKSQPKLLNFIKEEYSLYACSKKLEKVIEEINE